MRRPRGDLAFAQSKDGLEEMRPPPCATADELGPTSKNASAHKSLKRVPISTRIVWKIYRHDLSRNLTYIKVAIADVSCLYGLDAQHDPCRASGLARRTSGDDDATPTEPAGDWRVGASLQARPTAEIGGGRARLKRRASAARACTTSSCPPRRHKGGPEARPRALQGCSMAGALLQQSPPGVVIQAPA